MSEVISKRVLPIVLENTLNVSNVDSSSWWLNTTYVAIETMSTVCQTGFNIHEDAVVAILDSPNRIIASLLLLISLFFLLLYTMVKIGIF